MQIIKHWYTTAFLNFFIAALAGLVMRLAFVVELPIDYLNLRHAHSHMALFGWVYLGFFALLNSTFLDASTAAKSTYRVLFWVTEVVVIGMFISFTIQGYGGWSMSFTLLHILLSYGYLLNLWQDLGAQNTISAHLARTSMLWLFISTMGIWAVTILQMVGMGNSVGYHISSQFFLHFQLSGWLTFTVFALFFRQLEDLGVQLNQSKYKVFYLLLIIATVLTFALAIAWISSHPLSYAINGIGVLIQLGALLALIRLLATHTKEFTKGQLSSVFPFYAIVFTAFIIKILMQSALIVPEAAKMAHTIQNLVIGFIHLNVLGFVTLFIIAFALHKRVLKDGKTIRVGLYTYVVAVLLTEAILFLQGLFFWIELGFLPQYHFILFVTTLTLPLSLAAILYSQLFSFQKEKQY